MRRAEQLGDIGSWEWHTDTGEVVWSENCYRIYGYEPGEVEPSLDLALEATHPDDRERITRGIAMLREKGFSPPADYRIVRPDGSVHELYGAMALAEPAPGGAFVIFGSVQDLTERRRSERELNAHLAVSEAFDHWESFDAGAGGLLRALGEALSFDVGALWLPGEEGLAARAFWRADSLDADGFESASADLSIARGEGLLGRVWESLEPEIVPDVVRLDYPQRRQAAGAAGLHGGVALPARDGDELLAVLEFYSRDEVPVAERFRLSLAGIGAEVGHLLARHRGELAPVTLTPRELEILQLAAQGHSGRRIAEMLVLSPATVKTHFEHAYEKLEVSDRASAVAKALRLGLIE
jgi:PAS domain S-box-containing protein